MTDRIDPIAYSFGGAFLTNAIPHFTSEEGSL
jgi:hypothetical protein